MPRIKVVRIIARLNIGGPAIHVVLLNAGLDPDRFESLLVTGLENPGEGSFLDLALERGIQPIVIPEIVGQANFKSRDVVALGKLVRLLRRERPDIVHTHTAKAGFLGRLAARLAGVPVVVHTYHGHVLQGYYSPLKSQLLTWMEHGLAHLTDRLIAVSQTVREEIVARGIARPEKITVIPLGFELEPFLNCETLHGQFRTELGLPEDAPLVGIVGRLAPIKNHRLFLQTARQVAQAVPGARFVIVGDGTARPELEAYAGQLGLDERVIFTGWRHDLPRIYADLDVVVLTSDNEGTPVSLIEAMAAARPVVATAVGGVPDIVADGQSGYLAPAGDAAGLAAAIVNLLRQPEIARRMGQQGRAGVYPRFAAERLIADVERLYIELLTEKPSF